MAGTDKRKQSLYFPEDMLREIQEEANRQDRSLSWIVQQAWKSARNEIMRFPSVNDVIGGEGRGAAPSGVPETQEHEYHEADREADCRDDRRQSLRVHDHGERRGVRENAAGERAAQQHLSRGQRALAGRNLSGFVDRFLRRQIIHASDASKKQSTAIAGRSRRHRNEKPTLMSGRHVRIYINVVRRLTAARIAQGERTFATSGVDKNAHRSCPLNKRVGRSGRRAGLDRAPAMGT